VIIDCRNPTPSTAERQRVFVDGAEIRLVWYLDTELGLVRTYDVLGDGKPHSTLAPLSPDATRKRDIESGVEGWDMPLDGLMSKAIYGAVELRPLEDEA
jgi:hypothetical protein